MCYPVLSTFVVLFYLQIPSCYRPMKTLFSLLIVVLDFLFLCSIFILLTLCPRCLAFPSVFLLGFSFNQIHSSSGLVEPTLCPVLRSAFQPFNINIHFNLLIDTVTYSYFFILTNIEMVSINGLQLWRHSDTCYHPHIFTRRVKYVSYYPTQEQKRVAKSAFLLGQRSQLGLPVPELLSDAQGSLTSHFFWSLPQSPSIPACQVSQAILA